MIPFIDDAKTAILEAIKNMGTDLKPTIDGIKTNFDEWKVPWTAERAGKLDNLNVGVSTRSTQTSVDALTSKLAELDADVGETADTGGTQNAGTVNAKLNAVLQRQKVIRGLAVFSIPSNENGTNLTEHTIVLPQTITPQYANVSVAYSTGTSYGSTQSMVVVNVTNTTIKVKFTNGRVYNPLTLWVAWQVVGGIG